MKKRSLYVLVMVMVLSMLLAACSGKSSESSAKDSNFPSKPIQFIIPFDPGGSSDLMTRSMEKKSKEYLGQNLIIENKGGAGGTIGWNELAGKDPDGYTIGSANTSMILQPLYGETKYDYLDEFEPLALVASIPIVIAVKGDSPFETIEDLVAFAEDNPGDVKFGHAGLGSVTHVAGEKFGLEAEIKMEQVPFSGGGPALTALLGNHIDMLIANTGEIKSQVESGDIKVLAAAQEEKVEDETFKDVPTLMEAGYDVNLQVWQGVGAPKGLPADAKKTLEEGFAEMIKDPDFVEEIEKIGIDVDYLNAEDFGELWDYQRGVFSEVVEEAGIKEMIKE